MTVLSLDKERKKKTNKNNRIGRRYVETEEENIYDEIHYFHGYGLRIDWGWINFALSSVLKEGKREKKVTNFLDHFDPLESVASHIMRMPNETAAGDGSRSQIFVITDAMHRCVGVLGLGRRWRRNHHQRGLVMVRITSVVITRSANRFSAIKTRVQRKWLRFDSLPAARRRSIDVAPVASATSTQK